MTDLPPGGASAAGTVAPYPRGVGDPTAVQDGAVRPPRRAGRWIAPILAVAAAALLGYIGWALLAPGGSLVVPTLIVLGSGLALAAIAALVAFLGPRRRAWWLFSGLMVPLAAVAAVWTFFFALPAAVAWDPSLHGQALAVLARLHAAPTNAHGRPRRDCWTITTGSAGPVGAPYRECAIDSSIGSRPFVHVWFAPVSVPSEALDYTDVGTAAFVDECYRHLDGDWWMTAPEDEAAASGGGGRACRIGYRPSGGP